MSLFISLTHSILSSALYQYTVSVPLITLIRGGHILYLYRSVVGHRGTNPLQAVGFGTVQDPGSPSVRPALALTACFSHPQQS